MKKFFAIISFLMIQAATAQTGVELATKIDALNNGFVGESAQMKMVLIDSSGTKVNRTLTGKFLEVAGDGDKSIMTFITPKDVRGTKMLTWTHRTGDDDQWLYLPAVKRVKRISSRNKTSSFMGSEFSYEDLSSQEVAKYNYKLLKDATHKKFGPVWVLEKYPKNKSGYSKQVHYISKKFNQPVLVRYYDKKNSLLKEAFSDGFKKYTIKGKSMYRPSQIHMKNKQTRKESYMIWGERKLGVKLNASEFDKRNLR